MDRFACVQTRQLPHYCTNCSRYLNPGCEAVDAFTVSWGGGENNWIFLHSILGSAGVATHVGWRRIGNINCAVMALGPLVAIADNQARFLEEFCQGP